MDNDQQLTGDQARSYKKFAVRGKGNKTDFMDDLNFNSNANKVVQKSESKQTLKSIKDQIDYFGYEIEPFHMKHEREIGTFDQGGYFVFDKEKDKQINDAWLDQLDQSNVYQDLQEQAQQIQSKKQKKLIKEANRSYEEKNKRLIAEGFFKSKKYESKEDALNDQQHQKVEIDEEDSSSQQEEVEAKIIKSSKTEEKVNPLSELNEEQLKEILYELLEENQTPQQAMKRVRDKLQIKKPLGFKKNVRKQVKKNDENSNMDEETNQENKQTFDLLVDLCAYLLEKTNNPDIYGMKKEELIPNKLKKDNMQQQDEQQQQDDDNIF